MSLSLAALLTLPLVVALLRQPGTSTTTTHNTYTVTNTLVVGETVAVSAPSKLRECRAEAPEKIPQK